MPVTQAAELGTTGRHCLS